MKYIELSSKERRTLKLQCIECLGSRNLSALPYEKGHEGKTYQGTGFTINNELINKKVISTAPIKKARLNIVAALLKNDAEILESYRRGTSAESTIFRALFLNNGILSDANSENKKEKAFLQEITDFIDSCGDNRVCVDKLVKQLQMEPYGIRNGVIAPYLAYCISKRDEDVVLYPVYGRML